MIKTNVSKIPAVRYVIEGVSKKYNNITGYLHEPSGFYMCEISYATIYDWAEDASEVVKRCDPDYKHKLVPVFVSITIDKQLNSIDV